MSRTINAQGWNKPEAMAGIIAQRWHEWNTARKVWLDEIAEVRQFVFATDTRKTSAGTLGWKNSTVTPKLCQIRDNLHANYITGLFPNEDWLRWEAYDRDGQLQAKREAIQAYMSNKTRTAEFRKAISLLAYDYIDTGNAFVQVRYKEKVRELENGERIATFLGPTISRVDPSNIVFNPTVESFDDTPVIIREIVSLGDLMVEAEQFPAESSWREAAGRIAKLRSDMKGWKAADISNMNSAYQVDGFGSYTSYLESHSVELLHFYGDYYDVETHQLYKDAHIVVADRMHVAVAEVQPQWGRRDIYHAGWRKRPGNLWAQGPLANIVGMQYRIDHLENLKADVFDMIAYPVVVRKGGVSEFVYGPGAEVEVDEDGSVEFMAPPTDALRADNQIADLMVKMEEFAGAPRETMGIRSPGEKTAFEVQQLSSAAARIFQEKLAVFEVELLEPALNGMLAMAKQYMDGMELVSLYNNELGITTFRQITKEEITADGLLKPIGARHFAIQSQMIQNLTQISNSGVGQLIAPHMSGWQLAQMVNNLMGLDRFNVFSKNVAVLEQAEMQRDQALAQEQIAQELQATMGGADEEMA